MIQRRQSDIDTDTGQVFNVKVRTFTNFDNDKGYLFKTKDQATRSFEEFKLSEYVKDNNDFMRCHLLAEQIYKDTNMIAVRLSTRRTRPMDLEDISRTIGLSYKSTKEFLSKMIKLHIMAERTDIVGDMISVKYYFNPLFFSSKKYINADLYFLFQESLDCHLPGWAKQRFHEVGNIKKDV